MNLAIRDVRHNFARFILTVLGLGMLLMIVMGMGGIYRGLIEDATLLVDRIDADFWVVQRDTRGPFAEVSRVPLLLEDRLRSVEGVAGARAFVSHTIQREHRGLPLRVGVQGLSWPEDKGAWLPIVQGRPLAHPHYEMVADELLGLGLGEKVALGKDTYTVVGLTRAMVGQGGDGLAFFTVSDALAIQNDTPGEAIRLEREARRVRADENGIASTNPGLLEMADAPAASIPAVAPSQASAILVSLEPGADPQEVANVLNGWTDISVHTTAGQRDLLLTGSVDKARRQIGLFTAILVTISAIIMALILYTLTLDKVHDIAMLKLMGARNTMILGLIVQQAVMMGALGYGIAYYIGIWLFPRFPRRVIVVESDLVLLAVIVLFISVLSSILGIAKAMSIQPNEVLS
ncbi:MAG: putative transport system permease protein [Candidatus Sumerlaeota bacterium]|nr:putative transport system permease protein [Candidatus Sumerlaeota bacterium]